MAVNIVRKFSKGKAPIWLMKMIGKSWAPYIGAGITVDEVSEDFRRILVRLKKRWYNLNYVGTQFGGSIYSMTDPFYMLMLMNNLGNDYIVWDKAAKIRFRRPGTTDLTAEFLLTENEISKLIDEVKEKNRVDWEKEVIIKDKNGEVIAEVHKTIYVADKSYHKNRSKIRDSNDS